MRVSQICKSYPKNFSKNPLDFFSKLIDKGWISKTARQFND